MIEILNSEMSQIITTCYWKMIWNSILIVWQVKWPPPPNLAMEKEGSGGEGETMEERWAFGGLEGGG